MAPQGTPRFHVEANRVCLFYQSKSAYRHLSQGSIGPEGSDSSYCSLAGCSMSYIFLLIWVTLKQEDMLGMNSADFEIYCMARKITVDRLQEWISVGCAWMSSLVLHCDKGGNILMFLLCCSAWRRVGWPYSRPGLLLSLIGTERRHRAAHLLRSLSMRLSWYSWLSQQYNPHETWSKTIQHSPPLGSLALGCNFQWKMSTAWLLWNAYHAIALGKRLLRTEDWETIQSCLDVQDKLLRTDVLPLLSISRQSYQAV